MTKPVIGPGAMCILTCAIATSVHQQLTTYGSYDLPFGKGKQFAPGANRVTDLIIGGYQLSTSITGPAVCRSASDIATSVGIRGLQPQHRRHSSTLPPNTTGHIRTALPARSSVPAAPQQVLPGVPTPATDIFSWPGLDNIGNAGRNNYFGPAFFNTDLGITKASQFMRALLPSSAWMRSTPSTTSTAGNPGGNTDIFGNGTITGEAPGRRPRQLEFSIAYSSNSARSRN